MNTGSLILRPKVFQQTTQHYKESHCFSVFFPYMPPLLNNFTVLAHIPPINIKSEKDLKQSCLSSQHPLKSTLIIHHSARKEKALCTVQFLSTICYKNDYACNTNIQSVKFCCATDFLSPPRYYCLSPPKLLIGQPSPVCLAADFSMSNFSYPLPNG